MPEQISDAEFTASEGVSDSRVLFWGAKTLYETGDFATGARLVAAIAEEVETLGQAPLVDLRPDTVTAQMITVAVELARQISRATSDLGLPANPSAVQYVELALDMVGPSDSHGVLESGPRLCRGRAGCHGGTESDRSDGVVSRQGVRCAPKQGPRRCRHMAGSQLELISSPDPYPDAGCGSAQPYVATQVRPMSRLITKRRARGSRARIAVISRCSKSPGTG